MKKKLLTVIAGLVMTALPVTVQAQTTLNAVGAVSDASWVDGTTLLCVEGNNGYGLMTVDGKLLTPDVYSRSMEYHDGYIIARPVSEDLNCAGLLGLNDLSGAAVMPFQYGEVKVLSGHWAIGIVLEKATASQYDYQSLIGDNYYLIQNVDVYYLDHGKGNHLATLTRDQYMDARANETYIHIEDRTTNVVTRYDAQFQAVETDVKNIYELPPDPDDLVTYRENGQYGVKDGMDHIVMEPSFQSIYDFNGDYAVVSNGEKKGLIDAQGQVIVPVEYDDIKRSYYTPEGASDYNANGYFAVVTDGKIGFVDETGAVTCEPKYSETAAEITGASALLTDLEGNQLLIAADGVETVLEGYDRVRACDYGSGMYYEVHDADYNEGLIDWHGEELLPCEYSDISFSGDGQYILARSKDNYSTCNIYRVTYEKDGSEKTPAVELEEKGTEAAEPATETETVFELDAETEEETMPGVESDTEAETVPDAGKETETMSGAEKDTEAENVSGMETEAATEGTDAAGDASAVVALLDGAISLLDGDAAANRVSIQSLLENARGLLGEGQEAVASLLDSAITLLQSESFDAQSVKALLDSAKILL